MFQVSLDHGDEGMWNSGGGVHKKLEESERAVDGGFSRWLHGGFGSAYEQAQLCEDDRRRHGHCYLQMHDIVIQPTRTDRNMIVT